MSRTFLAGTVFGICAAALVFVAGVWWGRDTKPAISGPREHQAEHETSRESLLEYYLRTPRAPLEPVSVEQVSVAEPLDLPPDLPPIDGPAIYGSPFPLSSEWLAPTLTTDEILADYAFEESRDDIDGLVLFQVRSGSLAHALGLQAGDSILKVARHRCATPADFAERWRLECEHPPFTVRVNRAGVVEDLMLGIGR